MTDSYLSISAIANDQWMQERMNSCVVQQSASGEFPALLSVGTPGDPLLWVQKNRYVLAASPGWGEKWTYALDTHTEDPDYEPGKDEAVITDADILAAVQHLGSPEV